MISRSVLKSISYVSKEEKKDKQTREALVSLVCFDFFLLFYFNPEYPDDIKLKMYKVLVPDPGTRSWY